MAKNRELKPQPPKPVESESETSEEEDDETSSGSDSEPEPTAHVPEVTKQPLLASPVSTQASSKKTKNLSVPNPPHHETSEEEESESESESESDSDSPNPKPTLNATESMSNGLKSGAKNPSSNPSADPVTPSKPSIVNHNPEAKKSKNKVVPETPVKKVNDDLKKPAFKRIWSEKDEIAILSGMIEYSNKKKGDPLIDVSAFHNFIKKNLDTVDETDAQLLDKIRRMKRKYQTNKSREKKSGKEKVFPKAHEKKAYELSKVIWGSASLEKNGSEQVIETPKVDNVVVKRASDDDSIETALPAKRVKYFGRDVEDRVLMMGNEMFDEGIGADAEEWKNLNVEEVDVYLRCLDVKARRAKLVMKNLEGGRP